MSPTDFPTQSSEQGRGIESPKGAFGTGASQISDRTWLRRARAAARSGDRRAECEALRCAEASLSEVQRARLVNLLLWTGRAQEALVSAQAWFAAQPGSDLARLLVARALIATGSEGEAEIHLESLMTGPRPSAEVLSTWARLEIEHHVRPEAAASRLAAIEVPPAAEPTRLIWLARALAAADRPHEAVSVLEAGAARLPGRTDLLLELGSHLMRIGRTAEASAHFEAAAERDPSDMTALRLAGLGHRHRAGTKAFRRVKSALARGAALPLAARIDLHYAAGKAFEDIGDIPRAFTHFCRAGAYQKRLTPWSPEPLEQLAVTIEAEFGPKEHGLARSHGFPSRLPVLIVGMPRAGTTLVEQILLASPEIESVGETDAAARVLHGVRAGRKVLATLDPQSAPVGAEVRARDWKDRGQSYVRALKRSSRRTAARIIDKTPGNYTWAGLIEAAVPGCRFIHCRRHPLDACLSQFKLSFGAEIPYSYDLRDLGRAYRVYHRLMRHWSAVLPPGSLLHVRYEDVVSDLEPQARRIFRHIGLDWCENALRFHTNPTTVRTASAAQVRMPIYRSAIGGWVKYRDHLTPLIDEIGDLVEAYESERTDVQITTPSPGRLR